MRWRSLQKWFLTFCKRLRERKIICKDVNKVFRKLIRVVWKFFFVQKIVLENRKKTPSFYNKTVFRNSRAFFGRFFMKKKEGGRGGGVVWGLYFTENRFEKLVTTKFLQFLN